MAFVSMRSYRRLRKNRKQRQSWLVSLLFAWSVRHFWFLVLLWRGNVRSRVSLLNSVRIIFSVPGGDVTQQLLQLIELFWELVVLHLQVDEGKMFNTIIWSCSSVKLSLMVWTSWMWSASMVMESRYLMASSMSFWSCCGVSLANCNKESLNIAIQQHD